MSLPKLLLTLAAAAAKLPHRPHASAVWRWCRKGARARNGERIYLKHCRIGRRLYVDENDLRTFFTKLAEADREGLAEATPAARRRRPRSPNAAMEADAELRRRGA